MKKIGKILALIAAGAFVFGGMLTSCKSSDDDDDDPRVSISGESTVAVGGEITLTASASNFTAAEDGYTWAISDTAKATLSDSTTNTVTLTGVADGSVVVTVKNSANESVSASKTITVGETSTTVTSEYTNAYWDFATNPLDAVNTFTTDADLTSHAVTTDSTKTVQGATLAIIDNENVTGSSSEGFKWKDELTDHPVTGYGLYTQNNTAVSIDSYTNAPGLMKLVLDHASLVTIVYSGNCDASNAAAYRIVAFATSSAIVSSVNNFDGGTLLTHEVNNGTSLVAGTYYIYVNGARIHSIRATSLESAATFTASTNSDTANTVAVLGLVGTSVSSSDTAVATAAISDDKIAVTSVASGNATITVTDANSKTATIAVSVASSGAVTVGTITKYAVSAPVKGTDFTVDALTLTPLVAGLEYTASDATTYTALTKDTAVTLTAGSYVIRVAATDAYAASATASFTASAASLTAYTLDISAVPETSGTSNKIDDTVTVYASASNKTIKYASSGYVQMTGGAANVTSGSEYGLQLTLPAAATITATAKTKTAGKTLMLIDSSGTKTTSTVEMSSLTTGTDDPETITFTGVAAGTYMFGSSSGGCFIYSLKIEY